jgi:nucleoside-diphosphate-sugar epimerase
MYMNDGNKTKINLRNKSVFITGVAGFIGSNLAKRLLSTVEGVKVVGLDNMNHYYDVRLKEARLNELEQFENFSFVKGNLADKSVIEAIFEQYKPEIVVNLGAQAGVRYSITNPDAYVEANLIGFYNILEACRHSYDEGHTPVEHLVYASSSSVFSNIAQENTQLNRPTKHTRLRNKIFRKYKASGYAGVEAIFERDQRNQKFIWGMYGRICGMFCRKTR